MQSPSIDLKSVARSQWLKQHEQGSPTDVFAELFEEVPPTLLENELEVEAAVSSITAAIAREEAAEAAERHEIARAKEREAAWLEEWRQEAQAAKEKEKRELEEWKRQAQAAKAAEKAALRAEIESAKARVVASRRAERSGIPATMKACPDDGSLPAWAVATPYEAQYSFLASIDFEACAAIDLRR